MAVSKTAGRVLVLCSVRGRSKERGNTEDGADETVDVVYDRSHVRCGVVRVEAGADGMVQICLEAVGVV